MRIGVRAHDFGKLPARKLAETVAGHGFTAVQLALPKAIQGIGSYRDIPDKQLYQIRDAFEEHQVEISVLGCYIEPVLPNAALRREQTELFRRGIYCAAMLNAGCIATETGLFESAEAERPQTLDLLYGALEEWLGPARQSGVTVAIEPVRRHTLNAPRAAAGMLRRFSGAPLAIVFDPLNLLAAGAADAQQALWAECLEAFGGHIAALHVKDAKISGGAFTACALGEGVMQYRPTIANWLAGAGRCIPLLREGLETSRAAAEIAAIKDMFGA